MLKPTLVRMPVQHDPVHHGTPLLKPSTVTGLQVAGLQGIAKSPGQEVRHQEFKHKIIQQSKVCTLLSAHSIVYGHTMLKTPVLVPITEVKQHWAALVLGWVTAWEYAVLYASFFPYFLSQSNVCTLL